MVCDHLTDQTSSITSFMSEIHAFKVPKNPKCYISMSSALALFPSDFVLFDFATELN